jgi:hypothetical protein
MPREIKRIRVHEIMQELRLYPDYAERVGDRDRAGRWVLPVDQLTDKNGLPFDAWWQARIQEERDLLDAILRLFPTDDLEMRRGRNQVDNMYLKARALKSFGFSNKFIGKKLGLDPKLKTLNKKHNRREPLNALPNTAPGDYNLWDALNLPLESLQQAG